MARLAQVEVFAADEIAIVHVMNRTVRRCFLFGEDAVSGKKYDHRKIWIDEHRSKGSSHRYRSRKEARELLPSP